MSLKLLTEKEQNVVLECLKASFEGPFFRNRNEICTIFGLWPEEIQQVIDRWPVNDEQDVDAELAINNAMNNLLGYPHHRQDIWSDYISVSSNELARIFLKWKNKPTKHYFDGIM